ncbi:hypothetical protein [Brachybacterium kimchii]|uniref:Secreted protein n=1 Tax=Brachybacterium kimchii TaxID=2942909 RepID=A0ABY4N7J9_9MICO|nr:hypothetical protein [Brachybacterium kimchii]UQN30538.1 hypothetical protein M4486_04295 [Brachybacterium kimchii]
MTPSRVRAPSRRELLAGVTLTGAVCVMSACHGPEEEPVASTAPTVSTKNVESPRGLADHGTRAPEGPDGIAAFVSEQLIVRDGTALEDVTNRLRETGVVTKDADIEIDAPGLDEIIDASFDEGKPLALREEPTVSRYSDRPDGKDACERSVSLSLQGVSPVAKDDEGASPYTAVLYLVLSAAKDSWSASGVRVMLFAPD